MTISDVALRAGVSKATASRSLRGIANVSAATRDRVSQAARDLDFVATPSAARLATGRTSTVAVVTPFLTRWFFSTIISGAERTLRAAGYDVLLVVLHDGPTRDEFFATMPLRRRVDAVVLLTMSIGEAELAALHTLAVPVASIGETLPGIDGVRIDDLMSARSATDHLLGLGHRDIAYIGGDVHDPMGFCAPGQRLQGFRSAMVAAGLVPRPDRVVEADFTTAGGAQAAHWLLRHDPVPTAIFAASDEMAIGAMLAIGQAGLRVPDDISVIGFDDHELAEPCGLTTIAQPVADQGSMAAQLVLDRLDRPSRGDGQGDPPKPSIPAVVPTRLVVRRTTRSPRQRI